MDREISSVMELAAGLAALAALLALVLSGVFIGKKLGYDFLNRAEQVEIELQEGSLRDLNYCSVEMPMASLIAILKSNETVISYIYDDVNDSEGDMKSDTYKNLKNNITGRVRVYVEYGKIEAGYKIWVHDISCIDPYKHDIGGC